ncbi:MAG: hypothetical protein KGL78_16760 [Burkholderiales bacterium]|nr:hypothetical protein [Burkholderiales bacterium]
MKPTGRALLAFVVFVLAMSAGSQWWAGRRDGALGAEVARLARPGDIRMIASDSCVICLRARHWFDDNRIAFSECSVERDAQCRADFEALSAPGTPVILVRGRPQLGFDPQRLRAALDRPA